MTKATTNQPPVDALPTSPPCTDAPWAGRQRCCPVRAIVCSMGRRTLWLGMGLILCLLTACQSLPTPAWPTWLPTFWGATPTPTRLPVTTQLHLATWSSTAPLDAYFQQRLAAYAMLQPSTQVELQLLPNYLTRLRTLIENGEAVDVVRINAFALPDFVARGLLAPLPPALADTSALPPMLQAMTMVDGTAYCVPHEVNTLALFFNRDFFDRAQLAYPTADWTWDNLRATAEQLTDADTGHYGLSLPADFSRWLPFLYQAGGTVLAGDAMTMTLNSPAALTALEFYTNLVLDGMAAPPATLGDAWSGDAFARGDVAMVIEGNWLIPYLQTAAPTLVYGVAPLPTGPAGPATLAFVNCYALAAETTHLAAASQL
ncbi:MAG: sugar ABC transporter substrate-binding protein, partial [Caldilineaceae bacterium]|nr:sugar ABC transporter substrate-binding protein [Caldilineaceae bacterium]